MAPKKKAPKNTGGKHSGSRLGSSRTSKASSRSSTKTRRVGLLGVASGYNSESDDDYQPARPAKKPRGQGRAAARRAAAGSPPSSSSDASDSADSFDSDSSTDSGETLAARQQRRLSNSPARARGGGTAARRARAAAHAPAVITTWDQLPIAVLAQVAQRVCKHGSLPMAPRLACVCTSWSAAVDATPELWRMIDTAAIPAKSWVQEEPAGGGVRSPPSKKQQGAGKGKQPAGRRKGANKQLSAEQGLRLWAGSGRLQELQALLLYGEGGAGCADPTEEQARDANRQLSAALLQELADSCQQLRRVSLFGAWSLRPEEVSSALLSMPALSELWLAGARFPSLTGLTSCLCSVLEAAAVSGCPRLTELVVDGCASLGQKAITALCPSAQPAQPQGVAAADEEETEQHQPPQHAGPAGQLAAVDRRPAFPHLAVLDLSHCAGLLGKPAKLQLDDMQAALRSLRVLKLTGLGGLYGWQASIRSPASLPGFLALESLHIGCDTSAPHNGRMALRTGSSYVTDAVLLALAGKSLRLETLDLSGSLVTPDGLRQLAAAHAAGRPAAAAAAAAATAGAARASAAGQAAAGEAAAAAAATGQASLAPAGAAGAAALRVRDLQLDGSGLACDAGLVAVGECCCDSLEQLVVRNAGARLGDEGIRGLRACTKLAALDVAACSVTEEGLCDLLSALPAGVLEEVHLESCRSVSRGARQAAARGVAQLQEYLAAEQAW